jgi:hypothetical protein
MPHEEFSDENTFAGSLVGLAIGMAGASAAELKLLISNGMKEAVHDLAPHRARNRLSRSAALHVPAARHGSRRKL